MDDRRFFNKREGIALAWLQDGKCAVCGNKLEPGWHADHIKPWSKGGKTDITNAQALCMSCNMSKGDKMMNLPQWDYSLRRWQEQALDAWTTHSDPNFLAVATPGAGKTVFGLRVLHQDLVSGRVGQAIIIVPSIRLQEDWADSASEHGINLDPKWDARQRYLPSDMHGVVVTYHTVANNPYLFKALCADRKTLVIFDEIHHAGEELSWGNSIQLAFEPAVARLGISGTPFRTDDNRIPFVEYELEDGAHHSKADFSYSYSDALDDGGIVRHVIFPSYEGDLDWLYNDTMFNGVSFEDDLNDEQSRRRLQTAYSFTKQSWLMGVLAEADIELQRMRGLPVQSGGHPKAGGIVFATNKNHAEKIATEMYGSEDLSLSYPPVVVHYDDAAAHDKIKAFRNNSKPWLVSIKMVSEGVDIPRLRVAVYASNITTELFIRQAIGRIVRWVSGVEEQTALFYIAKAPVFVPIIKNFMAERDHILEPKDPPKTRICPQCGHEWHAGVICGEYTAWNDDLCECDYAPDYQDSDFVPISGEALKDTTFFKGASYESQDLAEIDRLRQEMGITAPSPLLLEFANKYNQQKGIQFNGQQQQKTQKSKPKYQRKLILRDQCNALVGKIHVITREDYDQIHGYANAVVTGSGPSYKGQADMSEDELKAKRKELQHRLDANRGRSNE